jgi:hypothetical protein
MTTVSRLRRAAVLLAAFTMACGDSTGPVRLSEEQVSDMLDAMSSIAALDAIPGAQMSATPASSMIAALRTANATVNVSQTVDCPNGGSASVVGSATDNPDLGTLTAQVTQSFTACRATSEAGRVWTFDGNPNIVMNLSASSNESTGVFSMTMTQVGGVRFASDLGSGSCALNLTFALSGTATSFTATLSGTACGRNVDQSITVTE